MAIALPVSVRFMPVQCDREIRHSLETQTVDTQVDGGSDMLEVKRGMVGVCQRQHESRHRKANDGLTASDGPSQGGS